MSNPIIERELIGTLRTRKAAILLIGLAVTFALLIIVRWPSDARVELNGTQSRATNLVDAPGRGFLWETGIKKIDPPTTGFHELIKLDLGNNEIKEVPIAFQKLQSQN